MVTTLQPVVELLKSAAGTSLVSLMQYGQRPVHRRDTIQLLAVLDPMEAPTLERIGVALGRHRGSVLDVVYFTPAEIRDSVEVFPIELIEMQRTREVLHGQDLLAGLEVKPHDLRMQLEHDLITKRLWFRQRYVDRRDPRETVAAADALVPVLRGMLHYGGQTVPDSREAVVKASAETWGVDGPMLLELLGGKPPASVEPYLKALDTLLSKVEA